MKTAICNYQKKIAAKTIIDRLGIKNNFVNLIDIIDELFDEIPKELAEIHSKEELELLILDIKHDTASNLKISRFLEIAEALVI